MSLNSSKRWTSIEACRKQEPLVIELWVERVYNPQGMSYSLFFLSVKINNSLNLQRTTMPVLLYRCTHSNVSTPRKMPAPRGYILPFSKGLPRLIGFCCFQCLFFIENRSLLSSILLLSIDTSFSTQKKKFYLKLNQLS